MTASTDTANLELTRADAPGADCPDCIRCFDLAEQNGQTTDLLDALAGREGPHCLVGPMKPILCTTCWIDPEA